MYLICIFALIGAIPSHLCLIMMRILGHRIGHGVGHGVGHGLSNGLPVVNFLKTVPKNSRL